jgi:GT2 family glycosyltransferase
MAPKISVIVLAWNGEAFLEACLASILDQDYPAIELIVVDNASTDRSVATIERYCPPARLIRNTANLGFAGGNNVGLQAASGEIVLLVNQDALLRPGCLLALAGAFEHAAAGIVGCKATFRGGERLQHAGGWVEWPLGLAHHYGYQEADRGQWDQPRQVEFVTGAALAARRTVLERIGPLDEQFWPAYFEDVDFCLRAAAAGFEVWYAPKAVIEHYESASTDRERLSRLYQKGRLRLVLKHLSPARFLGEFVPAELAGQAPAIAGGEGPALKAAYLSILPEVPSLLRRHGVADPLRRREVAAAIQQLHAQAWRMDVQLLEVIALEAGRPAANSHPIDLGEAGLNRLFLSGKADLLPEYVRHVQARQVGGSRSEANWPELKEYQFRSSIPLIGPWVERARRFWYGVAARWAVLFLMQQQEAINLRQAAIEHVLAQRMLEIVDEMSLLAARVTQLENQLEDEHNT